ncbi:MAG: hypothetical protein M2R45_02805 [Verrucomicrobia subdivision 3 bacterium]|nr:hypothetical protein [Limisphaerales bacterium]MCS1414357.1 hypothetical protein [Limisphaerales bacterium]
MRKPIPLLITSIIALHVQAQHPNSPLIPAPTTEEYNAWVRSVKPSDSAWYYQRGKLQEYINKRHKFLLDQGYIYENGRYYLPEPEPVFNYTSPPKPTFEEIFWHWCRDNRKIVSGVFLMIALWMGTKAVDFFRQAFRYGPKAVTATKGHLKK